MKLSIIMPVYNVSKYVEAAIESISDQMSPDVELVIVNDGSTDNSKEIIEHTINQEQYAGKQIMAYDKENGGLSDSRNYGLNKASGEYVWFFDSDDVLRVESLQQLLKTLETDIDLVHLYTEKFFDTELKAINKPKQATFVHTSGAALLKQLFNVDFPAYAVSYIVKRRILTENQFEFPKNLLYEDLATTYLVFNLANDAIDVLDLDPYLYRVNNEGITQKINRKSLTDRIDTVLKLNDFYENSEKKISPNLLAHVIAYVGFDMFNYTSDDKDALWQTIEPVKNEIFEKLSHKKKLKFQIIYLSGKSKPIRISWEALRELKSKLKRINNG